MEFDFASDYTLGEFLASLERHGSPKITKYVASGPGGGNPCVTLEFAEPAQEEDFAQDHEDGVPG